MKGNVFHEPNAREWGWKPTMFRNPPVSQPYWPAVNSLVYEDGKREDGGRPARTSLLGREMEAGLTDVEGQEALLYAALAAIACALKLCKVAPGQTVKEDNWPGGCPHRQEGAAVKR